MKKLWVVTMLFALFLCSCDKKNDSDDPEEPTIDSTALKYTDCADTTFIAFSPADSVILIFESWIEYNGPHPYTNERNWIKSTNPSKIQVSFGKIRDYQLHSLDKDSLIDGSLEWHDTYVFCGNIMGPVGYRSKYVGLRITENGKTHYGWIHKPDCYTLTEFAIDTNSTITRPIYAGKLKK